MSTAPNEQVQRQLDKPYVNCDICGRDDGKLHIFTCCGLGIHKECWNDGLHDTALPFEPSCCPRCCQSKVTPANTVMHGPSVERFIMQAREKRLEEEKQEEEKKKGDKKEEEETRKIVGPLPPLNEEQKEKIAEVVPVVEKEAEDEGEEADDEDDAKSGKKQSVLGFSYRVFPLPENVLISDDKRLLKRVQELLLSYAGFTLSEKGVMETLIDQFGAQAVKFNKKYFSTRLRYMKLFPSKKAEAAKRENSALRRQRDFDSTFDSVGVADHYEQRLDSHHYKIKAVKEDLRKGKLAHNKLVEQIDLLYDQQQQLQHAVVVNKVGVEPLGEDDMVESLGKVNTVAPLDKKELKDVYDRLEQMQQTLEANLKVQAGMQKAMENIVTENQQLKEEVSRKSHLQEAISGVQDEFNVRLNKVEECVKKVDQHFEKVDQHLEKVDQHLEKVDQRLEFFDPLFDDWSKRRGQDGMLKRDQKQNEKKQKRQKKQVPTEEEENIEELSKKEAQLDKLHGLKQSQLVLQKGGLCLGEPKLTPNEKTFNRLMSRGLDQH